MSFTPTEIPFSFIKLGGGLNNTSGPFNVAENESPDLQNIVFDKTGSIMPRNGYTCLNTTALTNTVYSVGLYWYRTPTLEKAIRVFNDKVYRMDSLDGTWDDITLTGPKLSTAAEYQCDFTTFNSKLLLTNDHDVPQQWIGSGSMSNMTVVTGLTQARFVANFQNYCLMANCVVSGVDSPTRVYWSAFKDDTSWDAADYVEVGYNDGQEITGLKVLGDRLMVYKTRSIWYMPFTGNADYPFLVFNTNSPIGCVAPFSIQSVDNGHIFLSYDGLWFTDGSNGYKLSDKVSNSIREINRDRITFAKSVYQFDKGRYWLSVADSTSTKNNLVFTYDTANRAFSKFTGYSASSFTIFLVNGIEERVYFDDYIGYTYRADSGINDNPSNTALAVKSYYYTDWKNFNDICDTKGIPHVYIYHSNTNGTLNFAYSYDFNINDEYNQSFSMADTNVGQYVPNGNFKDWSLGISSVPDNFSVSNLTVARESTITKFGGYSAKLTRSGISGSFRTSIHATKGISYWQGKTVTFGSWVYAVTANTTRLYIYDGVGEIYSSYHTGNSTWQWLSATYTVNGGATELTFMGLIYTTDTSSYFDSFLFAEGTVITNYENIIYRSDLGVRRDLTGRGKVIRLKFSNSETSTSYVIHGIGVQANLQSKS